MKLNKLKEIREENENTQQEVADILSIKRGTYASWECGIDMISTEKIFDYANYYHKSIDYILEFSEIDKNIKYNKSINLSLIGNRLIEIRKKLKLSQAQIAKSIHINQSTWWGYEKGKTLITLNSLIELSKKYNYSIDWILGRQD